MPQATPNTISIFRASLAQMGKAGAPDGTFRVRDLTVLAYSQGTTWWSYRGLLAGRAADALAPGYFDDASALVSHGDLIWVPGRDAVIAERDGHVVVQPMMAAAAALPCAA